MKITAVLSLIVNRKLSIALVIFALLALLSILLTLSPVYAQTPLDAAESIRELNTTAVTKQVYDDKIFNLNQIAGTADSLLTLLTGHSQLHSETNDVTKTTGALNVTGRMVAGIITTPPASGTQYFAQQIERFNPIQPAYAQGIGYQALTPVQNLWTVFRNISYMGFVIVFVIIGFMVMFRTHISPQAVATVQDSIPRIVIALILVTFSYAIVGLMIDLMFVFLNVVITTLEQAGLVNENAQNVVKSNVFSVVMGSLTGIFDQVFTAIQNLISQLFGDGFLSKVVGMFGGSIAGIILAIAMLFIMFRVFFMLLMAYVTIIILTVFGPFLLLVQAMPGNNGAREWFRQLGANIAVFPVVAIMFIFAGILSGVGNLGGINDQPAFKPGDIGQFPLLSGNLGLNNIGSLIGLGFLLMTPSAAQLVKDRFGVKGGLNIGGGVAAVGAAGSLAARPFREAYKPVGEARAHATREAAFERIYSRGMYGKEMHTRPGPREE
ncbi:MAG: hypothetical protein NUV69_03410 [Candidatus Curtissbacteria bacterium]|nr:hypothetical protein [Candidatus Curtissbacteria bacterium]